MSVITRSAAKIETENEEDQTPYNLTTSQENAPAEGDDLADDFSSELGQPVWSVVTYESVAVSGLTYAEAVKWVEKLKVQNISGLCIVTDEAAARISN